MLRVLAILSKARKRASSYFGRMKSHHIARSLLISIVLVPHYMCSIATAENAGIFSEGQTDSVANEETAIRIRAVEVDFVQLRTVFEAWFKPRGDDLPKMPLRLNLFDDAAFDGIVQYSEQTMSGGRMVSGVLDDVSPSSMAIVVNDQIIFGELHTPDAAYIIRTAADGRHFVREVELASRDILCGNESKYLPEDWEQYPAEANPALNDDRSPGDTLSPPDRHNVDLDRSKDAQPVDRLSELATASDETGLRSMSSAIDSVCRLGRQELPGVVDLLVAYTGAAKIEAGGSSQIRAGIDLSVGITNESLRNSGASVRIRLVGTTEVAYSETGVARTDIVRLFEPGDGYIDSIHATRNRCVADLVHLIVAKLDVGGRAAGDFGIMNYSAIGTTTLAHEIGHNFGLFHDRYQVYVSSDTPWEGSTSYPHGYVNTSGLNASLPPSRRWRTVMSYQDRCRDSGVYCRTIRYFSNLSQTYNGDVMGVPGAQLTRSVDGPADAVRTLDEKTPEVTRNRMGSKRIAEMMDGGSLTMDLLLRE